MPKLTFTTVDDIVQGAELIAERAERRFFAGGCRHEMSDEWHEARTHVERVRILAKRAIQENEI